MSNVWFCSGNGDINFFPILIDSFLMLLNCRKFSRNCKKAKRSFASRQSVELTIFYVIITRLELALLLSDDMSYFFFSYVGLEFKFF